VPARLFGAQLPPGIGAAPPWLTIFTSMFLHSGLMHLGGNMLFLWIFGNNIEDLLGPARYLLLYFGSGHGVVPLLYRSLNTIRPAGVPSSVMEQLRNQAQGIAGRNVLLATELLALLDLMQASDVLAMPYKGPALACQVYGDLRLRSFIDLDILVRRIDIPKVRNLLVEIGYQPKLKMTAGKERAILRSECDEVFTGSDGRVLEIHWAITPPFFSFPLQTEDLFARATTVELLGKKVLAPAPEDLLLILSVNGAKDMWNRLEFICRIAELLHHYPEIDWQNTFVRARKLGADRMLLLGLFLAHHLLGASLPADVLERVQRTRILWSMGNQVCERLFSRPEEMPTLLEFHGQLAHTLAGPPQRRFWLPPAQRLDQLLQVALQGGVRGGRASPPSPRPANPLVTHGLGVLQFPHPLADGAS